MKCTTKTEKIQHIFFDDHGDVVEWSYGKTTNEKPRTNHPVTNRENSITDGLMHDLDKLAIYQKRSPFFFARMSCSEQSPLHGQASDRVWSFPNCSFKASRRKKGKNKKTRKKERCPLRPKKKKRDVRQKSFLVHKK